MATNRPDTLDPALLRPGRLDRKVEFGLPDLESRTQIFQIHTRAMACERDVRFELLARLCPNSTGADIRSVCTEAVSEQWAAPGGRRAPGAACSRGTGVLLHHRFFDAPDAAPLWCLIRPLVPRPRPHSYPSTAPHSLRCGPPRPFPTPGHVRHPRAPQDGD
jgi:hypothetical protein